LAEKDGTDGAVSNADSSSSAASEDLPLVSVIIAVRNDGSHLRRCFAALSAQDYPGDRIEVVIADGRSTDSTPAAISDFSREAHLKIVSVDNPRLRAAAGFNTALKLAEGKLIVLLGARAEPAKDFISESLRVLVRTGADVVGGVVMGDAKGFESEAVALALASPFGVGDARYRYASQPGYVDTLNYGMYRRELFDELGSFDEQLIDVEDDEFNYRLRQAGKRLYLSPSIRCAYHVRPTLSSLAGQYARYGFPKIRVLLKHPRQMRPRQFVPAALVGAVAVAALGSVRFASARRFLLLIAAVYGAGSMAASVATARKSGWRYLPLLPFAFAGMHFGYGTASLLGAVRFGVPWLLHSGRSRVMRSTGHCHDDGETQ
jgi:succinoglycan biosynthesis protein ExoA